jgi:hypothetical protein
MIDRTADCFGVRPGLLAGDSAYGAAEMLNWLPAGSQGRTGDVRESAPKALK